MAQAIPAREEPACPRLIFFPLVVTSHDQVTENLKGFYTEDILADWAKYDPTCVDTFQQAVDTQKMFLKVSVGKIKCCSMASEVPASDAPLSTGPNR